MSNRGSFTGGFLTGTLIGGLVGAALGVALSRRSDRNSSGEPQRNPNLAEGKGSKQQFEADMEVARQSLEDKIAQLNTAIDDVRHQLHNVNGNATDAEGNESMPEER